MLAKALRQDQIELLERKERMKKCANDSSDEETNFPFTDDSDEDE